MNLPVIDLVFILIIVLLAVIGLAKGFLDEVLGKVIPVASIWIAFLFFGYLVAQVESKVKIHLVAIICSFLIVFIAAFILLKIVQLVLKKLFSGSILKSLDRFLGFVFGLVEGIFVVCIIILILKLQPWFNVSSILHGSIFVKFLAPVISIPVEAITNMDINRAAFIFAKGVLNV
ncbi:MAG: CvpA family protein [Treponema sp.]|nr:CvpA family protein [Spirochaetia bacterium]MDD7459382.1 CvpA family protein [Spirochaetales bacterium]MDY5810368.1 CvpA family protein [Treponema sp.]MEE1182094.1 CvpA family protein [Treponema sp.]